MEWKKVFSWGTAHAFLLIAREGKREWTCNLFISTMGEMLIFSLLQMQWVSSETVLRLHQRALYRPSRIMKKGLHYKMDNGSQV
jgi:hypothetical protein